MRHSSHCLAPSWALLCSQISVEPYIPQRTSKCKNNNTISFRAATQAQRQLFLVLFLLCFLVCQVRTCTFYMCPVTQKCFSGMVDLVCFKPAWSSTKASKNLTLDLTSIYSILSKQRATKAMIRLCG